MENFDRIAFNDNDLILGMHYLDAVYYNVERSFKTVILLSRAASHDSTFMTKFRIAVNHINESATQKSILIFLDAIPDNELPYMVRHYLSGDGVYLTWPEDKRGQEFFWNELIDVWLSN